MTDFLWLSVIAFCFTQLPLSLTFNLVPKYSNEGLRKLLGPEGAVIFPLESPLGFHDEI